MKVIHLKSTGGFTISDAFLRLKTVRFENFQNVIIVWSRGTLIHMVIYTPITRLNLIRMRMTSRSFSFSCSPWNDVLTFLFIIFFIQNLHYTRNVLLLKLCFYDINWVNANNNPNVTIVFRYWIHRLKREKDVSLVWKETQTNLQNFISLRIISS